MKTTSDVVIVGAGASGLCAAVLCARARRSVTVLEKTAQSGKKLSMTGNGRCNLSNLTMDAACYNEAARPLLQRLLSRFGVRETIDFFRSIGTLLRDEEGYLYPVAGQAQTVTDALTETAERYGATFAYDRQVKRIEPDGDRYLTTTADGDAYASSYVILATGGLSGPKSTASTGDGYYIAERLGMETTPRYPALTRMLCDDKTLPQESGVRALTRVTFADEDGAYAVERGETQITSQGLSGIPVMQASAETAKRLAEGKRVAATIDFFPDVDDERMARLIDERLRLAKEERLTTGAMLLGFCNAEINGMALKRSGLDGDALVDAYDDLTLRALLAQYKKTEFRIDRVGDWTQAQATRGGVALSALTDALEAKTAKGVFVVGELADVDGRCGGYNLQWAWTSAMTATDAILQDIQKSDNL